MMKMMVIMVMLMAKWAGGHHSDDGDHGDDHSGHGDDCDDGDYHGDDDGSGL